MELFKVESIEVEASPVASCSSPWTKDETCRFIEGLARYKGDWQEISDYVGTRSVIEVFNYWSYCFQGLSTQIKQQFYESILLDDKKSSLNAEQETDLSFFAQKIAPMISCGYQGLFSLVAGFGESRRDMNCQSEQQKKRT